MLPKIKMRIARESERERDRVDHLANLNEYKTSSCFEKKKKNINNNEKVAFRFSSPRKAVVRP